jgi:putative ABC transport system permease protein
VPFSLALRLLARDWRSGEVVVLVAALVVAVAAISSVTFFTDRVRQAVAQQAGESLAADLRIEAVRPLPDSYRELARAHDVATAEIVSFRSVVVAGETTALADVRGATPGYPLRGKVEIADRLGALPYAASGIPQRGEVWAEPSLLARLGANVGDALEVGSLTLRVVSTLEFRPDEGWRFMEVAPTVLLNMEDVRAAGLLGPGSVAEYELLFAGEALQIRAFREALEPLLEPGTEIEDFRDGRPEVRASVTSAERFLVLAALVSVLLGAVAVAIAARRFVSRRLDAVALMKCLGARYTDVLRIQVVQLALLVAAAAVVGSIIGFVAQLGLTFLLADFVEASLPAPSWRGALLGPVTALAVALGCALPPLLTLGAVPPARVLRSDVAPPPLRYSTIYGAAAVGIGGLLYVLFRDLELIFYVLAGAVGTFAALYWAGRLLVAVLGRPARRRGCGLALRNFQHRAARPRKQRAARRFRHRAHGVAAAHAAQNRANGRVAGDAAGRCAESLPHQHPARRARAAGGDVARQRGRLSRVHTARSRAHHTRERHPGRRASHGFTARPQRARGRDQSHLAG